MILLQAPIDPQQLTYSDIAIRRGIKNEPTPEILVALGVLAKGLEQVQQILGHSLIHSSGFRCPELNAIVGGAPTSAHLQGYAEDFTCPWYGSPLDIVLRLHNDPDFEFDQLIQEGTWVHISFAPAMRRQVLTAHFNANGKASYTPGIS